MPRPPHLQYAGANIGPPYRTVVRMTTLRRSVKSFEHHKCHINVNYNAGVPAALVCYIHSEGKASPAACCKWDGCGTGAG